MKIVFSDAYKDIFFKDKVFQKIKYSYASIYRDNVGLNIRTKQLDYPSIEKNFSNFLEPKTFLRRDYNFYKNDFFPVSHKYIPNKLINERDDNKLYFFKHSIKRDLENEKQFDCELITNQLLYFGKFNIHKEYIYFETEKDPRDNNDKIKRNICSNYLFSIKNSENMTEKNKEILMIVKEIEEIIQKRTLLINNSLEIFNKNGKSFFFNFFTSKKCEEIIEILKKYCKCKISIGKDKERINNIVSLYKKGEITNYEYLLYLNKLSTRTFNDWSQYPVFPWIITDIAKLVNGDKTNFPQNQEEEVEEINLMRDMNYPISMQSSSKREIEIDKFVEDLKTSNFPSHLGTHYSTSSYIYYYLMRNSPACQNMIKLQNYKQENPNRMFLSFKDTQRILKSSSDSRELIPDLFCYIDYLCNVNCVLFGERTNLILVDDFSISEEYNKDTERCSNLISQFVKYLYSHKKLLNDSKITKVLYQWVDIIFGKNQCPENEDERIKSCNIYGKLTYEKKINLEKKLDKYIQQFMKGKSLEEKLLNKINNRINIIIILECVLDKY